VPGGDAVECPAVRGEDDPLGEHVRLAAGVFAGHLDHDLMDGRLGGVREFMPVLRDDRKRRDQLSKRHCELVDLRRRGVPAGEDAEVDADFDPRFLVLTHAQRDRRPAQQ